MAVIQPFKALRPAKQSAEKVASVPYDVVNAEEAKELSRNNELSFLRVSRAEIELDNDHNPYSPEVYQKAKENLQRLISSAPMTTDDTANFYLYRLVMNGRSQAGIAAVFSIDDYDNNVILKHEKTRKEKEDDRTNHILSTEAQTGPVFLTFRGEGTIIDMMDQIMDIEKPLYDITASDGVRHTIWIIPPGENQNIIDEIGSVKNLYIADGHHRAASAGRARKEKQKNNPQHKGIENYNFFLGVLFPASQLEILPYNRIIHDLNGLSKDDFIGEVSQKFSLGKTGIKEPAAAGTFTMYLDGEWYLLKPKDQVKAGTSLAKTVADTLDVSVLQDFLLNPILGIDDPRTNKRIDFVGGIRGTKELQKLVDSGKAAVAFSLYPVSVNDLMKISDAGEIMPPKSTWFEPKLRDGFLVHLI